MVDLAISIAAKTAEYMVGPTIREARYCFRFNTFAEDLADAKKELESKWKIVKQREKEATERTEKIEKSVEEWLQDVEYVLEEVRILQEKMQASRCRWRCRSWFCGQCCRRNLAKQMAKKTKKMNWLSNNNKFEPFSRPSGLRGIKYYTSKDYVYFKSTTSAYNKLLAALKDNKDDIIGLYGMGGSGKTALVKEVGKKAQELEFFERAVIAVVSHTPNVRNIQDQLIDALGLRLEEQSNTYRAQRLSDRLRDGRTLVILDDVWEKLDFEQIGIPINDNNKACRVLLTTRSHEVCSSMQCQKIVQLSLLTKEESWDFFKRCSRITEESDSAVTAKKVADKCQGLPIAITTVGNTLRGKSLDEWKNALTRLERSHHLDVAKGMRNPYECIKLSYDNLTCPLAKSIFLLCSIFPEDSEIEVEDLVRFGKGLLPTTIGRSMEEARREINEAVNILLNFCLLLYTESKERVKVHDLVRDVALWIATKEGQEVMVCASANPHILEEDETIQGMARISLWDLKNPLPQGEDKSIKLPDQLIECPQLDTLLLHSEGAGFEIPFSSFERIGALKILAFIKFRYRWNMSMLRWQSKFTLSMLESIKFLTGLRTLCLRGYKLGDISVLESLSLLEILDLRGSSFAELPNGIAALKKLKLLDLFMCSIIKNNPYEVVGRCSTLEELYIWTDRDNSVENISFPKLNRYAIVRAKTKINYFESDLYNFLATHGPSRALCLENFDSSPRSFESSSLTKNLFQRAEGLYLQHLQGGCKNIIPNMDRRGMNQLIGLVLDSCLEIECLFDIASNLFKGRPAFSKLVFLRLIKMEGLIQVFCGGASGCTLEKLEELRIEDCGRLRSMSFPRGPNLCKLRMVRLHECQKLRSVFTQSICQTLVMLEELSIRQCTEMEHVIADDELQERIAGGASTQTHSSRVFPHLRILDVQGCERLESIIPVTFAQGLLRLEEINMRKNPELNYVFGPHNSMDEIVIVTEIKLLALRKLRLKSLPKLISICPEDTQPRSPIPKEFECIECPSLHPNILMSMMQQEPPTTTEEAVGAHETPDKGNELVEEGGQPAEPPKPSLLTRLCGKRFKHEQHAKAHIVNEYKKDTSSTTNLN
ncbi:hypothetical protein L6164_029242 [Bauhinia variegata]|uniref:Uncharacterized protein n=1 Tax=Bauhinia variegata TaxID=167791 RepID=A0ACB9L8P6_BAUVA|nr:hypothetical protein L6164_029242 [Bauhinia variegata]